MQMMIAPSDIRFDADAEPVQVVSIKRGDNVFSLVPFANGRVALYLDDVEVWAWGGAGMTPNVEFVSER